MDPKSISAFPIPGWKDDADFNGMTLRDYFAAKAMRLYFLGEDSASLCGDPKQIAAWSYAIADAMLAARE